MAAAGQGHRSQAQSQWAATAAAEWLRNLVVSGRPKEPRCLPCVYLAPWSSWELDLRGDLAWVILPKQALASQKTPSVIWGTQDQELLEKGVPRHEADHSSSLWEHVCCSDCRPNALSVKSAARKTVSLILNSWGKLRLRKGK